MKITINQITNGEDEVIINYHELSCEVTSILNFLETKNNKLLGKLNGKDYLISPSTVLYIESIDANTFIYTKKNVYQCSYTLANIQMCFSNLGYFRCSKSMIINIYHVSSLKSKTGNRIDAKMENGEHVIISRRYAKEFRKILKGDVDYEQDE